MEKTLQHFNQYSTESKMQWQGSASNRFPKPRLIHPRRDIIQTGLQLPDQTANSGRKHFEPERSGQFVFKPRLKQFGEMQHWHLRPSAKKVYDLQFSQALPRRERKHYEGNSTTQVQQFAGIKTFYNSRLRNGIDEYSVQDRMQRKVRLDQLSLRKNAFKDQSLVMNSKFKF